MELEGWFMEEFAPDWTMVVVLLGYIIRYVCGGLWVEGYDSVDGVISIEWNS